jgi:hypothetical protein
VAYVAAGGGPTWRWVAGAGDGAGVRAAGTRKAGVRAAGMPKAGRRVGGPPSAGGVEWTQKSMSPPPGAPAGAFSFSGLSATTASVVRNRAAIDAAFCSAERVTFAGSMMPASSMST